MRVAKRTWYLAIAIITVAGVVFATPVPNKASTETSRYLIKMRTVKTLEMLLEQDDKLKSEQHLRDCMLKKFRFGDFEAFSGEFTREIIAQLQSNPLVGEITPDVFVKASEIVTQEEAPRHLARLSQRDQISHDQEILYHYDSEEQGEGVTAYVLDTGVMVDHPDFEGRASFGADFSGTGETDEQGHGTHVAGVIGSEKYGVAKKVEIVSVKVLGNNGSGSLTSVLEGLEFAVTDMTRNNRRAVGNLSLGAQKNTVLNDAIRAAHHAGLVMVVAAGNSNSDACFDSPASSPYAITVGALDDRNDEIAPFSNWGECVDIFSPGVYVESLYNHNVHSSILMSGTSMSSPSVTGLVAILLGKGIRPANIIAELQELSTADVIDEAEIEDRPGTPNRILYNGISV